MGFSVFFANCGCRVDFKSESKQPANRNC